MAHTVIDCARARGRDDVIAWFAELGYDASDFAARSVTDDIVVDDAGQVLVRRYVKRPADAGRRFEDVWVGTNGMVVDRATDECVTELVVITPSRPFPTVE